MKSMKIRISIDVFEYSKEVQKAIKTLAISCDGEDVTLLSGTVKATFDITAMQVFAKGLGDIESKYKLPIF